MKLRSFLWSCLVVCGVVAVVFFVNFARKSTKANEESDARIVARMAELQPSWGYNVSKQDKVLWAKVVSHAYVCRGCRDLIEFNSDSNEQAIYPLVYSHYKRGEKLEYMMVVGTVAFHGITRAQATLTPTISYYARNVVSGTIRHYDYSGHAANRDRNGQWEPFVPPPMLERGKLYTLEVPNNLELNTIRNTLYASVN